MFYCQHAENIAVVQTVTIWQKNNLLNFSLLENNLTESIRNIEPKAKLTALTHVKHWLSCPHHRPEGPYQNETDVDIDLFDLWSYRQYYHIGAIVLGLGTGNRGGLWSLAFGTVAEAILLCTHK